MQRPFYDFLAFMSDNRATDITIAMMIVRVLRCFAIAALLTMTVAAATPSARIAFLDKGEVWVLSAEGGRPERQTRTGAKVEDFRFSPRGDYLAYAKRLRPGDGRPICSIFITNAATGRVIKEIRPDDGWIDIDKWLGTTLLYHASAAMEVSGFFEFDAVRRAGRELEPNVGSRTFDRDMTPDGSLLAYVDDIGLGPTFEERLHLVDAATGADVVQVSKRSVLAPAISPTKEAVAFIEVFGELSTARDRVWVYRRHDRSVKMISDADVTPKSAGSGLTWSPDSRYVSVNFGGRVTVLDISETLPSRTFRGVDACWSGAGTLVVGSTAGLEAIDVVTGMRQLVVSGGSRPQCLPALTK